MKPLFKQVGSKRHAARAIVDRMVGVEFDTYIEPMVGTGAVMLEMASRGMLAGKQIVLADAAPEIVAAWEAVQKDPVGLAATLEKLAEEYEANPQRTYDFYKNVFNKQTREDPGIFFLLRAACHNGVWRFNKGKGELNTPRSRTRTRVSFPAAKEMKAVSAVIADAIIMQGDVLEMMQQGDGVSLGKVLWYVDPPYYGTFSGYTPQGFDLASHAALIERVSECVSRGETVVYSNAMDADILTTVADAWGEHAEAHEIMVPRPVNADPEGRQPVPELLVIVRPQAEAEHAKRAS